MKKQEKKYPSNLHISSTSGLSFLMHDVIALLDRASYDKILAFSEQDNSQ